MGKFYACYPVSPWKWEIFLLQCPILKLLWRHSEDAEIPVTLIIALECLILEVFMEFKISNKIPSLYMHNTPKQRYFELRIYLNLLDQLYIPNNIVTFRFTNYAELVPPLIHGLDGGCWFPTGLGPDGDLRVFFPLACLLMFINVISYKIQV